MPPGADGRRAQSSALADGPNAKRTGSVCVRAITIRPIKGTDWRKLRDLRLAALQDDPQAFGSTFAEERSDPDSEWIEWAEASELGRQSRTFSSSKDVKTIPWPLLTMHGKG
jgi:hypothetical protein